MNMIQFRSPSRLTLGVMLSTLTFAFVAHAGVFSVGDGETTFLAGGPAGLKIEGSGKGINVKEAGGTITVKVPLGSLKTGISLRDEHLQKALNTKAHPHATLAVKRSALTFPEDKKSAEKSASGKFSLNGQTKDLQFKYKVSRTGSDFHVQGHATIDIEKFGMEKPCYLGVCVDKDVKVKVKFKVRDK